MKINFIIGTADKDHHKKVLEILEKNLVNDENNNHFVLVPDRFSKSSELNFLNELNSKKRNSFGQKNLFILGLSRLSWFFLKSTPEYNKPVLSKVGREMLLLSIIKQNKKQLSLFSKKINKPGFLSDLQETISNLEVNGITFNNFQELLHRKDVDELSKIKIHDLSIVYNAYLKIRPNLSNDTKKILDLIAFLHKNNVLKNSYIYFDGFTEFNNLELRLIKEILIQAKEVNISLILDDERPKKTDHLFELNKKVYLNLSRFTEKFGGSIKIIKNLDARINENLMGLNEIFLHSDIHNNKEKIEKDRIKIISSANPYNELRFVASQIRNLIVNAPEKYRYKDFLILAKSYVNYSNIIQPIFKEVNVPYFYDSQKSMDNHPLYEFLCSLYDIYKYHYRSKDIFRLLKTEIIIPKVNGNFMEINDYRDAVSVTENWVLKYGIDGNKWINNSNWEYAVNVDFDDLSEDMQDVIKKVRIIHLFIKNTIKLLFSDLEKSSFCNNAVEILYNFLLNNGILQRFAEMKLKTDLTLVERDQYDQIWNHFVDLLDEYVTIFKNESFSIDQFMSIIIKGLSSSKYLQIPPALDQVMISTTKNVQLNNNYKFVFIIGMTSDSIPQKIEKSDFLDDDENRLLNNEKIENIQNNLLSDLVNKEYLENYLSFLVPKENLVLSYPRFTYSGEENKPSLYINKLKNLFNIPIVSYDDKPIYSENVSYYLGSKEYTLSNLIKVLQQFRNDNFVDNDGHLSNGWSAVLNYFKNYLQINNDPKIINILNSLNYRNVPQKLNTVIADKLYGNDLNLSISKLETFYQNQYEYFLKYGLKLKSRDEFELSLSDTGQYFHNLLDKFVKSLKFSNLNLKDFTENDIENKINEISDSLIKLPKYQVLDDSERMIYLKERLNKIVKKIIIKTQEQQSITKTKILDTEIEFGFNDQTLKFNLGDGKEINIRGIIDRLDKLESEGHNIYNLVDYKSSKHIINYSKIYYGLSMQLITYLDAINQKINKEDFITGAFFLHLKDKIFTFSDLSKKLLSNFDLSSLTDNLNKQLLKEYSFDGLLINNDREDFKKLDLSITDGGNSSIYPFGFTKNGKLTKNSKVITEKEFNLLLKHNRDLIINAGKQILSGNNKLNPYKINNQTGLDNSIYKSIMQFDAMLPENNYHVLPASIDNIFKQIEDE